MSDRPSSRGPSSQTDLSRAISPAPGRAPKPELAPRTAVELVDELVGLYRPQIRRALDVELDGSETSLAFVDHHLRSASDEDRTPILTLLAASAGAYYGELVRTLIGGIWIGDGSDPRRLRLLMRHQFIYFSPVDQALEAIVGHTLTPSDPRLADAEHVDSAFRFSPETQDAAWLSARLAEVSPVPEDQFVSLTCRFETLKLMHELLATKHASEGRSPVELGVNDYLEALARDAQADVEAGPS